MIQCGSSRWPHAHFVAACRTPRDACVERADAACSGPPMGPTLDHRDDSGLNVVELEMRLRQHAIELLEPTIRKQGILECRLRESKIFLEEVRQDMEDLKRSQEGASSLHELFHGFRVELAGWDKERRTQEQSVGDRLAMQETEINALRESMEVKAGVANSVDRAIKNLADLVNKTRSDTTEIRRSIQDRLDLNRDKIQKLRDEFETRTMAAENIYHKIQDHQTSMNAVIAKTEEVVARMGKQVEEITDGVEDLWRSKASVVCLEEQQMDLTEFMRHVNSTISALKQQFGSLVDDVKAHHDTALQVVGQSTAQQIDAMRAKYEAKTQRLDTAWQEIEQFMILQKEGQAKVMSEVVNAPSRAFTTSDITLACPSFWRIMNCSISCQAVSSRWVFASYFARIASICCAVD